MAIPFLNAKKEKKKKEEKTRSMYSGDGDN